jgi:circadian clock protein KaiB
MKRTGHTTRAQGQNPRGETYVLRLFVAGDEPNSKLAKENVTRLCEGHLKGRHRIEIVDVFKDFQAALQNTVLVTPTLILLAPPPGVTIFGNLSDTQKVLAALRLTGGES